MFLGYIFESTKFLKQLTISKKAMKTNLKNFAIAIMLLAAPVLAAAQPKDDCTTLKTGIYFAKDGKLNVYVENLSSKSAKVVVKDAKDQIVYQKRNATSSTLTGLKFDMDGLPDGQYLIEISNDKDKVAQLVQLETPKKEKRIIAMN